MGDILLFELNSCMAEPMLAVLWGEIELTLSKGYLYGLRPYPRTNVDRGHC